MSAPLPHSVPGFVKALQMSKTQLFFFTEGHENDPYFYSKLCKAVCEPAGVSYEHRLAKEIPPGAGGKNALITFFKYARQRKMLAGDFKGKKTVLIFFLDKDIDDLLRIRLKSAHVAYTQYYDVENHLFGLADLAQAGAAAASFDVAVVAHALGNYNAWRRRVAATWKDWIKLCIFAQKRRIGGEYNYGVTSRVNSPLTGPIDPAALGVRMAQLQAAAGLSPDQFKHAFKRVSKAVDDLYAHGNHDVVFKGKWYSTFLLEEIRTAAAGRPFKESGFQDRLLTALALTISFDAPWADHFRQAVEAVIHLV